MFDLYMKYANTYDPKVRFLQVSNNSKNCSTFFGDEYPSIVVLNKLNGVQPEVNAYKGPLEYASLKNFTH